MTFKRLLALLLAAATLGGLPALAYGSEAPAPDELFALGEASAYGEIPVLSGDPAGSAGGSGVFYARAAMTGTGVPTAYDPRTEGLLPPVRTQGSWNSCWAVAAMGSAEVNGLQGGLLSTAADVTDLSERHLIYFFSHPADDPLGNSSGDYNINPTFWLRSGGNPVIAAMTMASWHGPADETATGSAYDGMSYDDLLDGAYAYADELHLENTYTLDVNTAAARGALKAMILEHGGAVLCLYYDSRYLFAGSPSEAAATPTPAPTGTPEPTEAPEPIDTPEPIETPEPSDPAEPADTPAPAPADPVEPTETPAPTEDPGPVESPAPSETPPPADTAEPAVETDPVPQPGLDGAAADPAMDGSDGEAVPPEDFTVCYYQDVYATTNHEMLVVGWDDDYPAENFGLSPKGAVPPGDGAWLCRNSHGGRWYGGDGYVWISYYDASAGGSTGGAISGRATVFQFGGADNYDHNYEYDGAAVLGYVNDAVGSRGVSTADADRNSRRWYGNVFTAGGGLNETLRAVSTYTYRPGVNYTLRVYAGLAGEDDPTAGTLAAELTGVFPYAGYHTVTLPEAVPLAPGERFAVVFEIGMASDRTLFVPACYNSSSWYSVNDSAAGQSFVSLNGEEWLDCYTLKNQPNVRVKAFTDSEGPLPTPTPTPEPTPTPTPILVGDVNGDGTVDRKDRIFLARHLAGWDGYELPDQRAADVNGDGTVDRKDRIFLARHLAGWDGYELPS